MKPIIKPFDRRWNYIQHAFIKFISFLVIRLWKCGAMITNKITILRTSVNQIYDTALSIFPHWISKACTRKHKNHSKTSSSTWRFFQNLCAYRKSWFIFCNCKSGRHNQQRTFRCYKLQHKMLLTNIPYTSLEIKGRKKGKTRISSPCRQIWMIFAINLCQDASLCGSKKWNCLFCLSMNQTYVMITYSLIQNTVIVSVTVFLIRLILIWIPIF